LGGGVILTQSHDIDYLYWLFGDIKEVYSNAAKKSDLEIDVEDTAQILLKFKNEILGSLNIDYLQNPSIRQMFIIGTTGKIFWDYYRNYFEVSQNGKTKKYQGSKIFERNDMFLGELRHFFSCIKNKQKPQVSIEDGKKIIKICLAAKQSATIGNKQVVM
jgi:predicted dehydrogenase